MDTIVLITTLTFLEQCMSSYAMDNVRTLHLLDFLESKLHKSIDHEPSENFNRAHLSLVNDNFRHSLTYSNSKLGKVFSDYKNINLGSNDNRYAINTHKKHKRFFQYSPFVVETPRFSDPDPFPSSTNEKASQMKAPVVQPFVDHFAGIRSWVIPFYNLKQKVSAKHKSSKDVFSSDVPEAVFNDHQHFSRENTFLSELKQLEELSASRDTTGQHEKINMSLNDLYDPTNISKSRQGFDSQTFPPTGKPESIDKESQIPLAFLHEQPGVATRDGVSKKIQPSYTQDFINDESNDDAFYGFSDPFYDSDYDYDYGWGDDNGFFDTSTDDCNIIDTKTCKTDDECNCYGIYFCVNDRCQTSASSLTSTQDKNPFDDMFWHDKPVF